MQGSLPPDAQEKVDELRDLQETAQELAVQKNEAETKLADAENALDELAEIDTETTMYREVGELLVQTDYDSAKANLQETVDTMEIRVETLEKQEERIQEQFEELQEELEEMLGGAGGGGPMGGMGPSAGG